MEKNKLNGWVVIDKPLGLTSTQVLGRVRKILGVKKVGHVGTLDPLASGVLPIAVGEATKTIPYLTDSRKEYIFTIWGGLETATGDLEGLNPGLLETEKKAIPAGKIKDILSQFIGKIIQIPPVYSAIKVGGEALYKKARRGEEVVVPSREVEIFELEILSQDSPHLLTIRCLCSAGTYIRTLGQDLMRAIGEKGVVSFLRRVRTGCFAEKDAISLENFEKMVHTGRESPNSEPSFFVSLDKVLADILVLSISLEQEKQIRMGQKISLETPLNSSDFVRLVSPQGLVGFARVKEGWVCPVRLLNL